MSDISFDDFLNDVKALNPEFFNQCSEEDKNNFSSFVEKYLEWCKLKGIDPSMKMIPLQKPTGKTFKMNVKYIDGE